MFCDRCRREFRKRNPQGRVLSGEGETNYHFQRNVGCVYPETTVCGRDAGSFEHVSGTIGIDLCEDDIDYHVQRGKRPCPRCWGQRWKRELKQRVALHA